MPEPQKNSPPSDFPTSGPAALVPPKHRTGTISRLPKEVRWHINQMMDDGVPYPEIIAGLAEHGKNVSEDMLSRWKKTGYQDHRREQRLLLQCAARRDRVSSLLAKTDQVTGFQATQQIATTQICEAVVDIGSDILREALIANPLNYFRMLNAFSRLTNGGLKCERHLAEEALRKAQSTNRSRRGKKGISASSVREMEQKLNLM